MFSRTLLSVVSAISISASAAFAESALWVSNFDQAKQTAAAEHKDLLMDFTGSDWCGWCIKLRKEVFDLDAFKQAAPKNFVLVELDYPQDTSKLSEAVQKQNERLKGEYAIRGYPTIFLADALGRPYAQTGYQAGGPEAYLKHLEELRGIKTKRDEAWKKAESLQGLEKAKALAEGLQALDPDLAVQHYKPVIDEIAKLDPKDESGVLATYLFKADLSGLMSKLAAGAGQTREPGAIRKAADTFIAEHPKMTAAQKQTTLMGLLNFYRPPQDNETVLKLMEEVKALDPNSEDGKRAEAIREKVVAMAKK